MMRFKKQKMIDRLTNEGLADQITPEIVAIMDNLDGQEVSENCWSRKVLDQQVYWCIGKDGTGFEVNEQDCE